MINNFVEKLKYFSRKYSKSKNCPIKLIYLAAACGNTPNFPIPSRVDSNLSSLKISKLPRTTFPLKSSDN